MVVYIAPVSRSLYYIGCSASEYTFLNYFVGLIVHSCSKGQEMPGVDCCYHLRQLSVARAERVTPGSCNVDFVYYKGPCLLPYGSETLVFRHVEKSLHICNQDFCFSAEKGMYTLLALFSGKPTLKRDAFDSHGLHPPLLVCHKGKKGIDRDYDS